MRDDELSPLQFTEMIRKDRSKFLYSIYQQQGIEGLVNYILQLNHEMLLEFPHMVTEIISDEDNAPTDNKNNETIIDNGQKNGGR